MRKFFGLSNSGGSKKEVGRSDGSPSKSAGSTRSSVSSSWSSVVGLGVSEQEPTGRYQVDVRDKSFSKLHKACWSGNLEKVKKHVKKTDVNLLDSRNRTPLHLATANGHKNVVWFLLGSKAQPNVADKDGNTPLLKAISCEQNELVQFLLDRGADCQAADINGDTGLHLVARDGRQDVAVALINAQHSRQCVGINAQNSDGQCPLMIAAKHRQLEMAELLLRHGASVNVLDKRRRNCLMISCEVGDAGLVRLFLKHGISVTATDVDGLSVEQIADGDCLQLVRDFAGRDDSSGSAASYRRRDTGGSSQRHLPESENPVLQPPDDLLDGVSRTSSVDLDADFDDGDPLSWNDEPSEDIVPRRKASSVLPIDLTKFMPAVDRSLSETSHKSSPGAIKRSSPIQKSVSPKAEHSDGFSRPDLNAPVGKEDDFDHDSTYNSDVSIAYESETAHEDVAVPETTSATVAHTQQERDLLAELGLSDVSMGSSDGDVSHASAISSSNDKPSLHHLNETNSFDYVPSAPNHRSVQPPTGTATTASENSIPDPLVVETDVKSSDSATVTTGSPAKPPRLYKKNVTSMAAQRQLSLRRGGDAAAAADGDHEEPHQYGSIESNPPSRSQSLGSLQTVYVNLKNRELQRAAGDDIFGSGSDESDWGEEEESSADNAGTIHLRPVIIRKPSLDADRSVQPASNLADQFVNHKDREVDIGCELGTSIDQKLETLVDLKTETRHKLDEALETEEELKPKEEMAKVELQSNHLENTVDEELDEEISNSLDKEVAGNELKDAVGNKLDDWDEEVSDNPTSPLAGVTDSVPVAMEPCVDRIDKVADSVLGDEFDDWDADASDASVSPLVRTPNTLPLSKSEGTLGRDGTLHGVEELWETNALLEMSPSPGLTVDSPVDCDSPAEDLRKIGSSHELYHADLVMLSSGSDGSRQTLGRTVIELASTIETSHKDTDPEIVWDKIWQYVGLPRPHQTNLDSDSVENSVASSAASLTTEEECRLASLPVEGAVQEASSTDQSHSSQSTQQTLRDEYNRLLREAIGDPSSAPYILEIIRHLKMSWRKEATKRKALSRKVRQLNDSLRTGETKHRETSSKLVEAESKLAQLSSRLESVDHDLNMEVSHREHNELKLTTSESQLAVIRETYLEEVGARQRLEIEVRTLKSESDALKEMIAEVQNKRVSVSNSESQTFFAEEVARELIDAQIQTIDCVNDAAKDFEVAALKSESEMLKLKIAQLQDKNALVSDVESQTCFAEEVALKLKDAQIQTIVSSSDAATNVAVLKSESEALKLIIAELQNKRTLVSNVESQTCFSEEIVRSLMDVPTQTSDSFADASTMEVAALRLESESLKLKIDELKNKRALVSDVASQASFTDAVVRSVMDVEIQTADLHGSTESSARSEKELRLETQRNSELVALSSLLETEKNLRDEAERECGIVRQQMTALSFKLLESERRLSEVQSQLCSAVSVIDSKQSSRSADSERTTADILAKFVASEEKCRVLSNEMIAVKCKLEEMNLQAQLVQTESQARETRNVRLESEATIREAELAKLRQTLADARNEFSVLSSDHLRMKLQLESSEQLTAFRQQSENNMKASWEDVAASMRRGYENAERQWSEQNDVISEKCSRLQQELNLSLERVAQLEKDLRNSSAATDTLVKELEQMRQSRDCLTKVEQNLLSERDHQLEQIEQQKDEIHCLTGQAAQLAIARDELCQLRAQLASNHHFVDDVRSTLMADMMRAARTQETICDKMREKDLQLRNVNRRLERAGEQINELGSRMRAGQQLKDLVVPQLQSDLKDALERLRQTKSDLAQLQVKLDASEQKVDDGDHVLSRRSAEEIQSRQPMQHSASNGHNHVYLTTVLRPPNDQRDFNMMANSNTGETASAWFPTSTEQTFIGKTPEMDRISRMETSVAQLQASLELLRPPERTYLEPPRLSTLSSGGMVSDKLANSHLEELHHRINVLQRELSDEREQRVAKETQLMSSFERQLQEARGLIKHARHLQAQEETNSSSPHLHRGCVDRSEVELLRQQWDMRSRLEFNESINQIKTFLEEQARTSDRLEQLHSLSEAKLRREYQQAVTDLQREVCRLQENLEAKDMRQGALVEQYEQLNRLIEARQRVKSKLLDRQQQKSLREHSKPLPQSIYFSTTSQRAVKRGELFATSPTDSTTGATYPIAPSTLSHVPNNSNNVRTALSGKQDQDMLGYKLRQELNRSINQHLTAGTQFEPANVVVRKYGSTNLDEPHQKAAESYLKTLKRNYLM